MLCQLDKAYKSPVLIADEYTFQATGHKLTLLLENAGIDYTSCLIQPEDTNDVVVTFVFTLWISAL
jgi:glycerol-1-phosphate dehydrogenase [NAD(P)+]